MESTHIIKDRYGVSYRVESDRGDFGWGFHLWHDDRVVGYMNCIQQPPILTVGDFKLYDDVRVRESVTKMILRKLTRRPVPITNYRQRGLGTAMFALLSDMAKAAGFVRLEGWISDVDSDENPDLPDWYRRRGFAVTMGGGKYPHQVATISKEL